MTVSLLVRAQLKGVRGVWPPRSYYPRFLDSDLPKVGSSHGAHYSKSGWIINVVNVRFLGISCWTSIARDANTESGTV